MTFFVLFFLPIIPNELKNIFFYKSAFIFTDKYCFKILNINNLHSYLLEWVKFNIADLDSFVIKNFPLKNRTDISLFLNQLINNCSFDTFKNSTISGDSLKFLIDFIAKNSLCKN